MHETSSSRVDPSIVAGVHVGGPPAALSLVHASPFTSTIAHSPVAEQDTFSGAPPGSRRVEDHVGAAADGLPEANTVPPESLAVATHSEALAHEMLVSDELVRFVSVHGRTAGVVETKTLPDVSTAAQKPAVGHEIAFSWCEEPSEAAADQVARRRR